MPGKLGRKEPTDWKHVQRYPLSAIPTTVELPVGQPVVFGINWYEAFDEPEKQPDGSWWIGRYGKLGAVRGGHAIAARPDRLTDLGTWYEFYDQGEEGACVGFACSRMQTLRRRRKYDGFWLYHEAQKIDEWPGEAYDGTSVRAGFEILRTRGPKPVSGQPVLEAGVAAYRWLTTVDEVRAVLASSTNDARGAVRLVNSWGLAYPHYVWLPYGVLERLLNEAGEAATVTLA